MTTTADIITGEASGLDEQPRRVSAERNTVATEQQSIDGITWIEGQRRDAAIYPHTRTRRTVSWAARVEMPGNRTGWGQGATFLQAIERAIEEARR